MRGRTIAWIAAAAFGWLLPANVLLIVVLSETTGAYAGSAQVHDPSLPGGSNATFTTAASSGSSRSASTALILALLSVPGSTNGQLTPHWRSG